VQDREAVDLVERLGQLHVDLVVTTDELGHRGRSTEGHARRTSLAGLQVDDQVEPFGKVQSRSNVGVPDLQVPDLLLDSLDVRPRGAASQVLPEERGDVGADRGDRLALGGCIVDPDPDRCCRSPPRSTLSGASSGLP
jgi:hypothetical protein